MNIFTKWIVLNAVPSNPEFPINKEAIAAKVSFLKTKTVFHIVDWLYDEKYIELMAKAEGQYLKTPKGNNGLNMSGFVISIIVAVTAVVASVYSVCKK